MLGRVAVVSTPSDFAKLFFQDSPPLPPKLVKIFDNGVWGLVRSALALVRLGRGVAGGSKSALVLAEGAVRV